jgi:hydroxyethylthiazole kinase-like uncharacterized protein yjeF
MELRMPVRVDACNESWPLHGMAASRHLEFSAASALPPHTLMQRAGLAVARLALAIAPHARRIWVASGPGNNGGDGFEAAMHLQQAQRSVDVSFAGDASALPPDARASFARAQAAGVRFTDRPAPDCGLAIDALLGLGASRAPQGRIAELIGTLNALACARLAVDLPTGLAADSGACAGAVVRATHTLSLLTLKPGLFTGEGREHSGALWFDDLGVDASGSAPDACLVGMAQLRRGRAPRLHSAHKGRFGDVIAVGGAPGMGGALVLAARAALGGGAGRVFACPLDAALPGVDLLAPELMWRPGLWCNDPNLLDNATVVAGCGGGLAIREALPTLLSRSRRLVLDADALNAVAADEALTPLLLARAGRGQATVLTPHPLEAARLLGRTDAGAVQAQRLQAAQRLADRFECTVLLKGSGSVIAAPRQTPAINPSGNARLASAGTGDVLAGLLAGLWSAAAMPADAFAVAQAAAFAHGLPAADGDLARPLTASALVDRLCADGVSGARGIAR